MKRLMCLLLVFSLIGICAYGEQDEVGSNVLANLKLSNVSQWKHDNGYDFPVSGSTSVDLTPISDYLTLLSENGIYLSLPELTISHLHAEYEWIYSEIGDLFYLTYVYYNDMSKFSLCLEVPDTYRPRDEALALLIASMLSVDRVEADKLYNSLQYNVIDDWCTLETDEYTISYYEPRLRNGKLAGFVSLTVEKNI